MKVAPIPENEDDRLRALAALGVLDTPPEPDFEEITRLASVVCRRPIALISFVDRDRQWFKSRFGLDAAQTPRDVAFCAHAILQPGLFEVADADADPRFRDNPLVTGPPGVKAYAGVPLMTSDGLALGTLCVIDHKAGALDADQRASLEALARQVMRVFELRRTVVDQDKLQRELLNRSRRYEAIIDSAGVAVIATDTDLRIRTFNPQAESLLGYHAGELVGSASAVALHDMDEIKASLGVETVAGDDKANLIRWMERHMWRHVDCTYVGAGGRRIAVTLSLSPLLDSDGESTGYIVVAKDTSDQRAREMAEARRQYIERAVQRAHAGFIVGKSANATMETLLDDTLDLTGCEYGFIGEILKDESGAPYLHSFAITDIAWDQTTREFYDTHRESGFIFSNLNTLFGRVLTSGEPVLSGHPASDPRSGGLPPGHPPMYNFCGVPVHFGHDLIGMIGLANYPSTPDDVLVESLRPLTNACGAIFHATRLERQRREAIDQLRVEQQQTAAVLESAVEAFIEIDPDGRVVKWNSAAEREFLTRTADAVGHRLDDIVAVIDGRGQGSLHEALLRQVGSATSTLECVLGRADGTRFPAEVVAWRTDSADGHLYAMVRNVTERQELLEQQRLRFQTETLLREVHHRVKNNMQVVSSMLSIHSSKLEDAAAREVFRECRERIRAMSMIHERLYATGRFDRVDVGQYLREMVPLIVQSNAPNHCRIEADVSEGEYPVELDRAVPLSLMATELLLNSMKHAFTHRTSGHIRVDIRQEGGNLSIAFIDDGEGDADIASRAGTGARLVATLARQIGATLDAQSGPEGTRVTVRMELTQ